MLDKNNPLPLYAQLESILREKIANGEWVPLQIIPSENELSKTYGISRMTARSVITTLVKEGLLYRVQGKGTFVAQPKISARSPAYVGILEQLENQGYTIDTQMISYGIQPANKKIAEVLNLPKNADVIQIKRVRFANDDPVSIHESYIPTYLCPDFNEDDIPNDMQLCHALKNKYALTPSSVHEILESVLTSSEEAKLLQVEKGYPLLLLQQINKTKTGTAFEYSKILIRGDKIKLEFDYTI